MTEETPPETPQDATGAPQEPEDTETPPDTSGPENGAQGQPDAFPRHVVEDLRRENAKYRQRAADRDALAERLHAALVAATGRLADPTDLPYAEDHLTDEDALTSAIDALLTRKPHLASRRPVGDVGQGVTGTSDSVDLAALLRARA